MFCPNCGEKAKSEQQEVCLKCGVRLQNTQQTQSVASDNKESIWYGVLGFLVPIAGLIIYCIYNKDKPAIAKIAGKGALISVIVNVAIALLYFILTLILVWGIE